MNTLIAGMKANIIDSKTVIRDLGVFRKIKNYEYSCLQWTNYGGTHQDVHAAKALMVSCNYYFYELGYQLYRYDTDYMDETAKGLGLGEKTGVELPEYIGHRANAETKRKLYSGYDGGWFTADQIVAAIGQSDNRFTPMQLAVYTAALANRGTRYRATFLNRVVSADYRQLLRTSEKEVWSTLNISQDAYNAYSEGMQLVTQKTEWTGTAYSTFKNYPIAIAAKTGTAQHGQLDASDNGAFVCYAPADNPRIAIAIYGEKAGHGSSLTTIAKDILDIYFEIGEIGDVPTYENKIS
jgi:penicillin-binding protein 2